MYRVFIALFAALMLWLTVANAVFRFRHPWATETEAILNIHHALLFEKVPYSEMRPR